MTHATELPFFDQPTPLAIAHRGGAKYRPNLGLENSLRAFANAVDAGYTYLETDVHASRDGVVYAFHDATLDRVTDGTGTVAELDAADVGRAKIGGQEPIPALADLFEELPQARFNIDVKADSAVDALVDLIEATKTHERVCVASFSTPRLRRLRVRLGSRVATSMGPSEVAALRSPVRWLRRRAVRGGASCVQVPHRAGRVTVVTAHLVAEAHRRGLQVHVWTVDDPDEMRLLLDRGVDGIISDRIDTLRDVLIERGDWHGAKP